MIRRRRALLPTGAPLVLAFAIAPCDMVHFGLSQAHAADLALKAPPAPAAPAPYSWTGWYAGANAGYGVGQGGGSFTSAAGAVQPFNANAAGAFGGAQFGYNYQLSGVPLVNILVVGAETDIQGAGIDDNRTCLLGCTPNSFATATSKLDWFGTTRVRAGLPTGPVLSYVTGGIAYGGIDTQAATAAGVANSSTVRTGWTWGTGVEAALGGNWTAKAEYLYIDFGTTTATAPAVGTATLKNQEQLFRAGLNYRFGVAPQALPRTRNFAGFFVGGTFGAGIGNNPTTVTEGQGVETFNLSPRGIDGGAIGGYNWQFGSWVAGIEGDWQASTGTGYVTGLANGATADQKLTWFSTARGRFGYAAGEALFYGTAGGAWGGVQENLTQGGAASSFSHTRSGLAVGAGIENRLDFFGLLSPNWATRTEYLFLDLGSVNDTFAAQTLHSTVQEHIWRTVISYKFGPT